MFAKPAWLAVAILGVAPSLASAQLKFAQPTANLGELRGGPIYQQRFDFVNDSPLPLEITDIRLGCGCLQPMLEQRIFQPGAKGALVMNLRTLGLAAGAKSWQAQVQYRHGDKTGEAVLVLGATIRNEVTVEPSIMAMTVETVLKQEVSLTDKRRTPLKVTAVQASSPALRVTLLPTKDGVTRIAVEVSRSALTLARHEATLDIYTDDPNYRHLQVPITLIKAHRAAVSATPERIEAAGAGSHLVRLRGAGDKVVRVEKAETDHPAIKLNWAAGPGNDATLKISVDGAKLTIATAEVRVRLTAPTGETLTIPVVLRKE